MIMIYICTLNSRTEYIIAKVPIKKPYVPEIVLNVDMKGGKTFQDL
jgi:hypothetical protein